MLAMPIIREANMSDMIEELALVFDLFADEFGALGVWILTQFLLRRPKRPGNPGVFGTLNATIGLGNMSGAPEGMKVGTGK